MNTLVAVAIAPFGVGDELAPEVAEVVRVIRESGLPNKTYSMFTEIEGEWDEVMRVVRDATFVLAQKGRPYSARRKNFSGALQSSAPAARGRPLPTAAPAARQGATARA